MIRFGEWLPDLGDFENPGATVAMNCVAEPDGYSQLNDLNLFSNALDAYCRGAIAAVDFDANVYNYCGNESKLYVLADDTWTDKSIGGGYSTAAGESWEFLHWGDKILATNFADNPQSITLGGAAFANLTTDVKARHIAAVRNFVVLGNTYDAADTNRPNRVRWSAINDETSWTVSAATQADYQDLHGSSAGTGGWVKAVRGGEYGVVFQEFSIWRMTYVGSPAIFQFDEVAPGEGTPASHSVVQDGDVIYYLGQDGFASIVNGSEVRPIGANRVDDTFYADLDTANIHRVVGVLHPSRDLVIWSYPSQASSDGLPDKVIIYNRDADRWSNGELEMEYLYPAIGTGYTLEGLDTVSASIDALTESLDSRAWQGGLRQIGAFDSSHKLAYLSGSALTAVVETSEAQLVPGQRAVINSVRPIVDGGTTTVTVGGRNRQQDTYVWDDPVATNVIGDTSQRSNARYHRARVSISGGFTRALGVEAVGNPAGAR